MIKKSATSNESIQDQLEKLVGNSGSYYVPYKPYFPFPKEDGCPNCGYCPHCGRSNRDNNFEPYKVMC